MEEIKINVSTKVWVYCILGAIVAMVALLGLRYYIDSNGNWTAISLIISGVTTIVIVSSM